MNEMRLFRGENLAEPQRESSLMGEVIYESVHRAVNKKTLKKFIHRAIDRHLQAALKPVAWGSYLVIFSPGQEYDEVRCQIDIETDGERAGFAVGYGHRPNHAFNDAMERMEWYEKNAPIKMTG